MIYQKTERGLRLDMTEEALNVSSTNVQMFAFTLFFRVTEGPLATQKEASKVSLV